VGGTWLHAYDERLAASGRTADRIALWANASRAGRASSDDRRAAAARVHELGAAAVAAELIEPLAASAGPGDPDVEALVFYWGPHPTRAQQSWLLSRLRTAPAADQPGWIARMVNAGGARDAILALPELTAAASPAFVEAWLAAHRAALDPVRLRAAVEAVLARDGAAIDDLRHAGLAAREQGLPDLALRAYEAILRRNPDDLDAVRWAGTLAFYAGRMTDARRWLAAYEAAGGDDPEPLYQLGELVLATDEARARRFFVRALNRLTPPDGEVARASLRANVLTRLDERVEAIAAFEALLEAQPDLNHVRADYAAALLAWGEFDAAGHVLGLAPADTGPLAPANGPVLAAGDPDGSGAVRLDLWRVQWLNYHGWYGRSEDVLDALADRHPAHPDVLVARADFDGARGRPAAAEAAYQAARSQAPNRDDLARLLAERARAGGPFGTLRAETRSVGRAWEQRLTGAGFEVALAPGAGLRVAVEQVEFSAPAVLRADGVVRPLATTRHRIEAAATAPLRAGTDLTVALLGSDTRLGAAATLRRHDLYGSTSVVADLGRPFWEFSETAAAGGWRDRAGVERQFRFGARTSAWALANWQRYRLTSGAGASSAALTLGIVRNVRAAAPTIVLQYGLDVEHRLSGTTALSPEGVLFRPIPLASREVHVTGVVTRFSAAWWDVETAAGYTIDRLGGRGAFGTAHLVPRPDARMGLELWVDRRLYQAATSQHEIRAGAALRLRVSR
jgi:tetratricopeptide (TPR) repeat protein